MFTKVNLRVVRHLFRLSAGVVLSKDVASTILSISRRAADSCTAQLLQQVLDTVESPTLAQVVPTEEVLEGSLINIVLNEVLDKFEYSIIVFDSRIRRYKVILVPLVNFAKVMSRLVSVGAAHFFDDVFLGILESFQAPIENLEEIEEDENRLVAVQTVVLSLEWLVGVHVGIILMERRGALQSDR